MKNQSTSLLHKLFFPIFLIFGLASASYAMQREPQFRIWRSSALQGGNYSNVLFSSETVIFHMIIGSPTFNTGGNSYFVLLHGTGNVVTSDVSTRAFVPLESTQFGGAGLNVPFDVLVASRAYYSKQGAATINILWDFLNAPPNYTTGGDAQTSGRNP